MQGCCPLKLRTTSAVVGRATEFLPYLAGVSRPLQSRRKDPDAIALSPPLITEEQIGEMVDRLGKVIRAVA